ncbi:MAG TPA: NAD(P)/FAD-dependent oxidoreductase [Puia sp.]|nr:NAD(P)/FAD-dependent oxidoreductase [Puia sp.]
MGNQRRRATGDARDFDAVVVGSGPNGLAAAILLRQQGLSVLLLEAKQTIGGGLRSAELTLPGFVHDICSAVHPLAISSPFLQTLPLAKFGLEFLYPPVAAAHPLDGGAAALLAGTVSDVARTLGPDERAYSKLMGPIVQHWEELLPDLLAPLHLPKDPLMLARFGWEGLPSATWLARRFRTVEARALIAGMAAHGMQPLSNYTTAAIALLFLASGHDKGWPIPRGGSMAISNALGAYYLSMGGKIETGIAVTSFAQLPSSRCVLLDLTPRQLLRLADSRWSPLYRRQLGKFRYGMGVFKIDWALAGQIPFLSEGCRAAGTVHIGGTFEEIAASEEATAKGILAERPFVLLAQPSVHDSSRAPAGRHVAWAYCHVPNGSQVDMTERIERQVERMAPGFRELILARHVYNTEQLEEYNPNYVGGDINGGVMDIRQFWTRPALKWSPYRTSEKSVYICSASTPPGGGVHGMCGYHAAKRALRDVFGLSPAHP